jgi:hypothetical protein
MQHTNVGPPLDVGPAKLAVTEARKAYEAAVARYRAAVNPTEEELDRAETHLSDFDAEETYRHRRNQQGLEGLDADERILDQITEHQRDDEDEGGAKSAGV